MSAMQQYINGESIAISLRMVRNAQPRNRPVVLVEGETDVRLYRSLLRQHVDIVPGTGKHNILGALRILESETYWDWIVPILDADFDRLLGVSHDEHIILTDHHDIECEYIHSYAFVKVIDEFSSRGKCGKVFPPNVAGDCACLAEAIRDLILNSCAVIGCFRLTSIKKDLGLKFKGMDHGKVLARHTIDPDLPNLIRVVLANGAKTKIDPTDAQAWINEELSLRHPTWQVCQGHDLVKVACLGIRRLWGDGTLNEVQLERCLRLAYEASFFWATSLGLKLRERLIALGVTFES